MRSARLENFMLGNPAAREAAGMAQKRKTAAGAQPRSGQGRPIRMGAPIRGSGPFAFGGCGAGFASRFVGSDFVGTQSGSQAVEHGIHILMAVGATKLLGQLNAFI